MIFHEFAVTAADSDFKILLNPKEMEMIKSIKLFYETINYIEHPVSDGSSRSFGRFGSFLYWLS